MPKTAGKGDFRSLFCGFSCRKFALSAEDRGMSGPPVVSRHTLPFLYKKHLHQAESESENTASARQRKSVGLNALSPAAEGFFTGTRHFFAALLGGTQEKITMEPGEKTLPGGYVFL